MPDLRPKLLGGPLDGARIAEGKRPAFVWVGGSSAQPRVFSEAGPSRLLYRHMAFEDGAPLSPDKHPDDPAGKLLIETFLFAGHTHRACEVEGAICVAGSCTFCEAAKTKP